VSANLAVVVDASAEDVALAHELLAKWDGGQGISKSQLEIKTWNDATSHGRHFDRFISNTLGISTTRRSRQSDRIKELEDQVRGLGEHPVGTAPATWETQLQHGRNACLEALRIWNDPTAVFRTEAFSMLFVAAWNSLAIALLQRDGLEWRKLHDDGEPVLIDGAEKALDTRELLARAFPGERHFGLRQNCSLWLDLRNAVAHRSIPPLDPMVIPYAQAGLLNFEAMLSEEFDPVLSLARSLTVPLQLSGFRDPGVLASRKRLFAALPLDVQAVLSRADAGDAELLADPTFMLRVAFIPAVPSSGRSPDAVAYFVRPGEVPDELAENLDRYVVLAKPLRSACTFRAGDVVSEVARRTGFRFHWNSHAAAARALDAWPKDPATPRTVNERLAEYNSAFKGWLYSQAWIDLLVEKLSTAEGFREITGREPVAVP
jgi:hypothetical protein